METSDAERGNGVPEKGDVNVSLTSVSGEQMESNGIEPGRTFQSTANENAVLNGSSSSGVENRVVLDNFDRYRRGRERLDLDFDQDRKIRPTGDEYKHSLKGPNDTRVRANRNSDFNTNRPEYVKSNENELEGGRPLVGSLRSRPVTDQRNVDRNSPMAPRVNASSVEGQRSFADFPNPNVGPSNYVRGSYYNYGERMGYSDGSDGLARVENLENDRVELLRKLDELTDQLTRSCDVADKPRERIHHDRQISPVPPDTYHRHDALLQDGMRFSSSVNKQNLAPDKHIPGPPYVTQSHGYVPYMDRHGIPFQKSYPGRNFAHEYGGFPDVYQPQMLRRPFHQPPNWYFQESCYEHFPGHQMNFNQDMFMSHPHGTFFHQPACSCLHCVDRNWQVSSQVQPTNLCSRNTENRCISCSLYQHVNPATHDPQGYISEGSNLPQSQSWDINSLMRSSSDLDRETTVFGHSRLKKVVVANGGRRIVHPIAGGAPFITCCNCFELLKLPKKLMLIQKNQRKMKCGSCSSMLLFELAGKGIVISCPAKNEPVFVKVAASSSEMPDENSRNAHDFPDTGATSNSDAYENINYNFQLADAEPVLSSGDQKSNFGQSEMRQDHNSFSSSSEAEQSPDSVIVRTEACSDELPSKAEVCLPLPDASSEEYPDSLSKIMHKYGQGNKSKRTDQERNTQDGKTSRQNSLKDTLMATDMDVSYNDHSGVSHDSAEICKLEDLPRINKGGESFFVGLIKRSFGDFSRSTKTTESGMSNVSVNGHFIPDQVVKKAEKLSGPIQPGEYWYDFQAGFWGVMGHPCLGIIPPKIEEFNYPIPENCAGGNTEVFVNGRELHQRDLDLLGSRGLPTTRHKYYLIDISGRIVDEDTGEELDGIGKLAPTVERSKHGFGMKVPKSLLVQPR